MSRSSSATGSGTLTTTVRTPRWGRILSLAVVVAALAIGVWTLRAPSLKEVSVVVDGRSEMTVNTRARDVQGVLDDAGIVLGEGDEVTPAADAAIRTGDRVTVRIAERVRVLVDDDQVEVAVIDGTVRDALIGADVVMGPLDRVVPVRETQLEDGMQVQVIRVVQEVVEETESIPFRTLRWAEPQLEKGKERIVREGKEGVLKKSVRLTYENGELAHRQEIGHEVVEEAVNRVIGIGTRETVNVIQTTAGSFRYVDVVEVEATAYTPGPESTGEWSDGYTYTGLLAGPGVVAVDPEVIPLGTRLYIPGYGEAIAADIGGAIKGYRIDLGFETVKEAREYGRQKGVKVYILAD